LVPSQIFIEEQGIKICFLPFAGSNMVFNQHGHIPGHSIIGAG
jgi:hypothetical protein